MSITVALEDLAGEVGRRGPGYLLTTTEGGRPHVMQLRFEIDGSRFTTAVGRSAARNIAAEPEVTLLWPPFDDCEHPELAGYSLIVDAVASLNGEGSAVLEPTSAVLHRPA
jgi:hypothetical protein